MTDEMWPITETRSALSQLRGESGDFSEVDLVRLGRQVRQFIPECVGLTIASTQLGASVAFTLVASDTATASLDGVQYLADGPCVEGARSGRTEEFDSHDPLDETSWELFARASAASGVASTLTLPIVEDETVVGTVNIYASAPGVFDGHHEQLAELFMAWAPGAVTNADLSFHTREVASQAPETLRTLADIDTVTGLIADAQHVDLDVARRRLHDAALRAGVDPGALAKLVLDAYAGDDEEA